MNKYSVKLDLSLSRLPNIPLNALLLPNKSSSPPISPNSLRENEKVNSTTRALMKYESKKLLQRSIERLRLKLPSTRDFNCLLRKYDEVVTMMKKTSRIVLVEGINEGITLNRGTAQYFTLSCKQKNSPLTLTISPIDECFEVFFSRTRKRPAEDKCDQVFIHNHFCVYEKKGVFRNPYVYLGILSKHDIEISLKVSFGICLSSRVKSPRKSPSNREEALSPSQFTVNQRTSPRRLLRIIKGGVPVSLPNSPKALEMRLKEWEQRRDRALLKRRELQNGKKSRALFDINKSAILGEQQRIKDIRDDWGSALIRSIYIVKLLGILNNKRYEGRQLTMNRNSLEEDNRIYDHIDLYYAASLKASDALKTYKALNHTVREAIKEGLVKYIKNTAMKSKFSVFRNRILQVQHIWKSYIAKNKQRMIEITQFWDETIKKLVKKTIVPLTDLPKKKVCIDYNQISSSEKNRILDEYMVRRKQEYIEKVSEHLESAIFFQSKVLDQFKKRRTICYMAAIFPEFKYMPTEAEMIGLIKTAIYS